MRPSQSETTSLLCPLSALALAATLTTRLPSDVLLITATFGAKWELVPLTARLEASNVHCRSIVAAPLPGVTLDSPLEVVGKDSS